MNSKPAYDESVQMPVAAHGGREYPRLAWSAALTTQMIYELRRLSQAGRLGVP